MAILTASDVAPFLDIDPTSDGLDEAIQQAEALTASRLRLKTLEAADYTDSRVLMYTTQQFILNHGPAYNLTAFTYEGEDKLSEVEIEPAGWAVRWSNPEPTREFVRVKSFERLRNASASYSAGWTASGGANPLPTQIAEYVKAMTGLVYRNLLLSGVYDTKLGDMTIKMQRETLEKTLDRYDGMISQYARKY